MIQSAVLDLSVRRGMRCRIYRLRELGKISDTLFKRLDAYSRLSF